MTDRLTPGMLRERAIIRALLVLLPRMTHCAAERGDLLAALHGIEEAARREAEAKPVKVWDRICPDTGNRCDSYKCRDGCDGDKIVGSVEAKELGRTSEREDHSRPLPQVEREGPGSADAKPFTLEVGKSYRRRDGSGPVRIVRSDGQPDDLWPMWGDDNHCYRCDGVFHFRRDLHPLDLISLWDAPAEAPAGDDLPMMTAEQLATLKLDVKTGEIEHGYNIKICVSQLVRVIEAQAREITTLNLALHDATDGISGTLQKDEIEALQARVARLTEALTAIDASWSDLFPKGPDGYEGENESALLSRLAANAEALAAAQKRVAELERENHELKYRLTGPAIVPLVPPFVF